MIIYLAGMESILTSYTTFDLKKDDSIFCTFFYRAKTDKMLDLLGEAGHKGIVTVDSGAHSFFGYTGSPSASHQQQKADSSKMPDPEEYLERYILWLKQNWNRFTYFVELDIQSILGLDKIKSWRERLREEGLFSKCITVYHSCDTWEDYVEMIETTESGYVGLEGVRNRIIHIPYIRCLKLAYEKGVKVHGFALTSMNIVKKYPFYSVDSTTWTSTVRYGSFISLDKQGMLVQKTPTKKNYLDNRMNLDLLSVKKGKESSVKKLNHSAEQFRLFEKTVTNMWISRGVDWYGKGLCRNTSV